MSVAVLDRRIAVSSIQPMDTAVKKAAQSVNRGEFAETEVNDDQVYRVLMLLRLLSTSTWFERCWLTEMSVNAVL